MATIKFDQVGLTPPGVAGQTRTDGLATGAEVTITTSEPGTVQFLWVPLEDAGASASLHQVSASVWKFTPNSGVYGTYRVKFTPTANPSAFTVRLFGIRTPNHGMRIPALNEDADPNASLINHGASVLDASECNEPEDDGPFASGNYGGWYSAVAELMRVVDGITDFQLQSASSQGLELTEEDGTHFLTLHFGSGAGEIASGSGLAAAQASIVTNTANIATNAASIVTNTANISSLSSSLSSHTGDTSNPHSVTKAQVGLSAVSNDLQLKRADNDWGGYTLQTGAPAAGDQFIIERAADGAKRRMLAASLDAVYGTRNPVWDRPTTGTSDDDEFDIDTLASGAWSISLTASMGTPMTRDGALDMSQAIASGHYRSSVIGGVLHLQIRQNEEVFMWKTVAGALSSHQIWFAGIGMITEMGTANTLDPRFSLQYTKNNGGVPSFADRAFIRTLTSNESYQLFSQTASATVSNLSTNPFSLAMMEGIALRINHGSAAAGNFGGFGFKRNGTILTVLNGNSQQFNSATDKVGFNLQGNTAQSPTGVNNTLFLLHFFRRVDIGAGKWLAQA
jgi:hypothetical protein